MATETTTTPKAMRVINPELQAMAKIDEILASMEVNSRARVVAWVISTYVGGKVTFTSTAAEVNGSKE